MPVRAICTEESCYIQLREAITTGALLPNQRLVEMDLVQSIGAGRATVRTALARLEQEGMVQRERYRGARVRLVTESEAVQILEARAALEGLTVRYAARLASPQDVGHLRAFLAELEACEAAGDLLRYSRVNSTLHQRLVQMSGHATAARLIATLQSQNVRFQYRTILVTGRRGRSLEEHRAIVEAVAAGNADRAEAVMRTHLSHVTEALRMIKDDRRPGDD